MRKEKATEFRRAVQLSAQGATDEQAITIPSLYGNWNEKNMTYHKGNILAMGGKLYRCIQDHTSQANWAPGRATSLWVAISDPSIEFPAWVQPTGAHDAYAKGAKVSHKAKKWVNDIDANVWEPGANGWTAQA